MSRIDDLIADLCPDGVEYRKLGELESSGIVALGRGAVISKTDIAATPGGYPVYSSSGSGSGEFGRYGKYMFDDERITWSIDGGGRLFYRAPHRYSVTNVCGWMTVNNTRAIPKYLYYALTVAWSKQVFDYTRKAHPSVIRDAYIIPVPPLEVQREIVSILDTFTRLEAELEAELEARTAQLSFHKDLLLDFEDSTFIPLLEIAEIGTGSRNTNEGKTQGEFPFYVRSQKPLRIDTWEFDETAIITAGDGVGVGKVFHFTVGKYALHQRAYRIVCKDKNFSPRFLFHYIRHHFGRYLEKTSVHASVTSLRRPMFEKYLVPVVSLPIQIEISQILDQFDALVSDMSTGLPAEIAARRQQYEYYRDKLLTFDELTPV